MKIQARTTYDRVRFDTDSDIHLVLSLTAPALAHESRPPLAIMLAIDVSGSMAGPKLEYAKKSALKLVDHLKEEDYVGLVSFESSVKLQFEPRKATESTKAKIRQGIQSLRTLGGTNLSGGMLTSLEAIRCLDLPVEYVTRVILLTDGQANEGIAVKSDDIVKLLEKQSGRATLSAFGYGNGADQNLLTSLSGKGKGNYAFIENPDDALTAFGKELGGLLSTYAQDLVIEIDPQNGHQVTGVISEVEADTSDLLGEVVLKVPNILAEETRHLVLGVKLAKQSQALPRSVNLANIKLTYRTLTKDGEIQTGTEEAKARIRFVKAGEEQDKPDQDVDLLVALAGLVKTQKEAEEAAKAGNYNVAREIMTNYSAQVNSRGHRAISLTSDRISSKFDNHASYTSNMGYLRGMSAGLTRSVGTSSLSRDTTDDLLSMNVNLSNAAQMNTVSSFTAGESLVPDAAVASGSILGLSSGTVGNLISTGGSVNLFASLPDLVIPEASNGLSVVAKKTPKKKAGKKTKSL